jgi:uncharacterized circularly permuted ATP-grasp superfamily protein/uncharacterized alpha-E superfamily protein
METTLPIFEGYPKPIHHDEVYGPNGEVRPHWQYLLQSLGALGFAAIEDRQLKASRILRDDGANYKLLESTDAQHVWKLNPIPLLIDSEEWSLIENAIQERSELYNLILEDLYGPQTLIKHRIIPPELVLSNPSFLRTCFPYPTTDHQPLIFHAVDLVRDASGDPIVIADRTQSPSGSGYALENRTVMTRVFPSLFRESHVHRLAHFFTQLRFKLNALNPNGGIPRVIILTPGPHNDTYFEHAYLSNYLGFPLLQGKDLTVRDGFVWMKSLDGLKRVDVILRRIDDLYMDPVELRGDSLIGIPGISEVVRSGRIVIANPMGAAFLENPALYRYLPEIGRHLQGREPRLKSVNTWWCGDPNDLAYVLEHLPELFIKHCYRKPGFYSVCGPELDEHKLTAWRNRILKKPWLYVAQECLKKSSAPTWYQGKILPRPSELRVFTQAGEGEYSTMPGGLTRASLESSSKIVSSQPGLLFKDTWVLASEPEKAAPPRHNILPKDVIEIQAELSSRVAENVFWMGRYAERAEATLRYMRTLFLQFNRVEPLPDRAYRTLLRGLTQLTKTEPGFLAEDDQLFAQPETELFSLIKDPMRIGSAASSLKLMLNAAEEVQEQMTSDTQRIINDIGDELDSLGQHFQPGMWSAPEEALDPLVTALLALSGLVQESMVRDYAWHFIDMGRRIERTTQMTAQIKSLFVPCFDEEEEEILVEALLMTNESINNYRRRFHNQPEITKGLAMLLMDTDNPRSILYQLNEIGLHMKKLPGSDSVLAQHAKSILEATTAIQLSDLNLLAQQNDNNHRLALNDLIIKVQRLLGRASDELTDRYFDHTQGPQMLVRNSLYHDE